MHVISQRLTSDDNGTFSIMLINGRPYFVTLELPWKNNQSNISCIPPTPVGVVYHATKMFSEHFQKVVFVLHDVPGRDLIEFHIGNRIVDTHGCILLGMEFDVNEYAIVNSKIAFDHFMDMIPSDGFTFTVNDVIVKGDTVWV